MPTGRNVPAAAIVDGTLYLIGGFSTVSLGTNEAFTPTPPGVALLNGGNTFSGNQTVVGTVNATSFMGSGSGLTGVTAVGLNCAGCVGNTQLGVNYAGSATQGGPATSALVANLATNASALGGVGPSGYAPATGSTVYVAKAGDTMTGDLNLPNLNASGKVSASSSLVVGGGTAIREHLSQTFTFSPVSLRPSACSSGNFTFAGASDGDTLALGVANALIQGGAGILNYFAWVSAANTITIRVCNLNPNSPASTAVSGTIRVDLWKH